VLKSLAGEDQLRVSPFVASGLETTHGREVNAPYKPGDLLWVREAWRVWSLFDGDPPRNMKPGPAIQYPADDPLSPWDSRTRSPIHMPRWASRITLIVEDVRVQRLQDISEEDAMAEGVDAYLPGHGCATEVEARALRAEGYPYSPSYRDGFGVLWTTIHGPGAWDANPWVAAITFRRQA
jgi:hypothetical protein